MQDLLNLPSKHHKTQSKIRPQNTNIITKKTRVEEKQQINNKTNSHARLFSRKDRDLHVNK